jgi:hypothetical protein
MDDNLKKRSQWHSKIRIWPLILKRSSGLNEKCRNPINNPLFYLQCGVQKTMNLRRQDPDNPVHFTLTRVIDESLTARLAK